MTHGWMHSEVSIFPASVTTLGTGIHRDERHCLGYKQSTWGIRTNTSPKNLKKENAELSKPALWVLLCGGSRFRPARIWVGETDSQMIPAGSKASFSQEISLNRSLSTQPVSPTICLFVCLFKTEHSMGCQGEKKSYGARQEAGEECIPGQ